MKKNSTLFLLGGLLFAGVSYAQTVETFTFTGAPQTFTVPACVTEVIIEAHGAQGSDGNASTSPAGIGGNGAVVSGTLAVSAGDVLNIYVGGAGTLTTGGYNGGGIAAANSSAGGGGASDVRLNGMALTDRILVAGGGGAGGNGGCFGNTVAGGNGGGGGANGTAGTNSTAGGGGFPGVGTTGGAFGIGCGPFSGQAGVNGANGVGGAGGLGTDLCSTAPTSGGSGGGGYVGGGGGGAGAAGTVGCQFNDTGAGAGGAGGDCFVLPTMSGTNITPGSAGGGDGMVTITYVLSGLPTVTQTAFNELTADQSGATYQWIDCNTLQPIAGATDQTFTATVDGSYAVQVIFNGCDQTSACTPLIFVGLDENTTDYISVYPNPTTGNVTIDLSTVEASKITLFNALGKEVHQVNCSGENVVVDMKNYASGVYLLKVETNKGTVQQRIVRQ